MHKSGFCAFVIDFKDGDLDAGARFWSGALGRDVEAASPDSPTYRGLAARASEPLMLLQKVDHDPRVHLDIETDDIEAEVARLENLGAKRVAFIRNWWVMEAPTGQRFCVVAVQRAGFAAEANVWE